MKTQHKIESPNGKCYWFKDIIKQLKLLKSGRFLYGCCNIWLSVRKAPDIPYTMVWYFSYHVTSVRRYL